MINVTQAFTTCWRVSRLTGFLLFIVFDFSVHAQDEIQFDPPEELKFRYNQSLQLSDPDEQISVLIEASAYYELDGDYASSEHFAHQALGLCLATKRYEQLGTALNELALIYRYLGMYEESLRLSLKAFDVEKQLKQPEGQSEAMCQVATVFFMVGDYEKALIYIDAAIELGYQVSDKEYLLVALGLKSLILSELDRIDEAVKLMDYPINYYTQQNDSSLLSGCYSNLAYIYWESGNWDACLENTRKEYLFAKTDEPESKAVATANLVERFVFNEEYDSALFYAHKGLQISESRGLIHTSMMLYGHQYACYKAMGKYEEALAAYLKYIELKDEILSEENVVAVQKMEADYKLESKQKTIHIQQQDIKLLERDKQISNLQLYALSGGAILFAFISLLIYRNQRRKHLQKQQILEQEKRLESTQKHLAKLELEKKELENKQLQSEIDYKTKELENLAHHIVQKNDLLEALKNEIKQKDNADRGQITQLINVALDKDKEEFENHIDQINSMFYKRLTDQFPDLNSNDLRLLSLLKINMSSKDISAIFNITPKSVDMARYRLRKKMGLSNDVNISKFLQEL